MYPNNPAYFHIRKLSTIEHKAKKFLDEQKNNKTQSLLEYCREQGIAFTDTDKVMYNLQTSKKLHYLLKQFIDNNIDFLIDEQPENEGKSPSEMAALKEKQKVNRQNKYQGAMIAFDKNGEFNKNLNEQEMIHLFGEVMAENIKIPLKKLKAVELEVKNHGKFIPTINVIDEGASSQKSGSLAENETPTSKYSNR